MAYVIEPLPLSSFLDDAKIKLPRFQRKSTWKDIQNFKLCISVYKEFPVGVVIINKEQNSSWLLDGRQRRNALKLMRDNPVMIYEWAKAFLKIKMSDDTGDITTTFWEKIDEYLQRDPEKDILQENDIQTTDDDTETTNYEHGENSFDAHQQQQSLKTLQDIILMVHPIKKGVSKWERSFDFLDYFNRLQYAPLRNGQRKIDPVLLRKFIVKFLKDRSSVKNLSEISEDELKNEFGSFLLDEHEIREGCIPRLYEKLKINWDSISSSFNVIERSERLIESARIGIIWLTNASMLDAQNIFSLVNSGGTKLKAEELLSAKPFWNIPVPEVSRKTKEKVADLYDQLDVTKPADVVRWDVGAVLLSLVDTNNLIFKNYGNETVNADKIALGFKLLSSVFSGGMSSKHVSSLEKNKEVRVNWEADIDELTENLNNFIQIILDIEYFKYLKSWDKSIMDLTTNAIALEFIVILFNEWKAKGMPTANSGELKSLKRDAVILFDRLIYENATKGWRGSGDSRMASDIKTPAPRLLPISQNDWESLINDCCKGIVAGTPTTVDMLRPILYHYYSLKKVRPTNSINTTYDVDHIIPKERFVNNNLAPQNFENSLANLALLPTKDNISKKSKALKEISDDWLKAEIEKYTGIQENEFLIYSDISNVEQLRSKRSALFKEAFTRIRESILAN